MGFLELMVICGTGIALFAIYMEYRSKGVGIFLSQGRGKREADELREDIRDIKANLSAMRESMEQVRELNADTLIELERQQRLPLEPERAGSRKGIDS